MNRFFHLWRRELGAIYRTSIAYVVGVFFLLITGFSFWTLASRLVQGAAPGLATITLAASPWLWLAMLVATPLLTMRIFAEERRLGTLELLLTAPVTETEVVLAKFAGAYAAFLVCWLPTTTYLPILKLCGAPLPPIDWGLLAAGYFGIALIGAFFLAVGLVCSLLTRHQAVAAMSCLAALGLLLAASALPLLGHSEPIRQAARAVAPPLHMREFAGGIVDTRAVVWYASATALLLFASIRILEARRLR